MTWRLTRQERRRRRREKRDRADRSKFEGARRERRVRAMFFPDGAPMKNWGLGEPQELVDGKDREEADREFRAQGNECVCWACGHTTMEECYEADCQCCSSACT